MDALQKSITGFASETLKRRHKKLLKRGYGLAELDDETRYRARIAAKKVRYATEFFPSLFDPRAVKHYVSALSDLQDDLGLAQRCRRCERTAPVARRNQA
jgi:CHAD domain-containing protein